MTDDVLTADQIQAVRDRVAELMPGVRADLEALVRIPSVSAASFDQAQVARSAEAVAELLRAEGLEVDIVTEGGRPAVIGHVDGPEGAPTVTLYAHHDVQPPGEDADWDSAPFEPVERDGRLYGRGAADDKAGVLAHVAALRAHRGALPVGVTVFVEGEEESGSPSLPAILERHGDRLAADAIVIADSGNWAIGTPALTTTLRGGLRVIIRVETLDHSVHSGMFGGAAPDAVTALVKLLATLHDDAGDVAVAGLDEGVAADLDYDEARFRAESGLLDGVELIGSGSILSRLWTKPSITTIGIDATSIEKASNTLAAKAAAKISVRLAPSQDPARAFELVRAHLEEHAPWGARVTVELTEKGAGFAADADGPLYDQARSSFRDAWGVEPVDMGVGGSIPFISDFAARFPEAAIIVTGVEDPDTRAHGANESLHLEEFARVCEAEAIFLARLGAQAAAAATAH
ncbi:dipeptidase [Intrasporangium sp. DVR]|uniref:dipeptidase n=1 Tax=Intrasporangium sp. DVR TaxID=3127867 RepID=UPI00313A4E44